MERKPNTQYVASISYGKDSLAMLEAIKILGYPLDRIVTAEVWATDDIQADLPPMVEFKDKADKIIKERYGIDVEHFCAMTTKEKKYCANFRQPPKIVGGTSTPIKICSTKCLKRESMLELTKDSHKSLEVGARNSKTLQLSNVKLTYENVFYRPYKNKVLGFPIAKGNWCNSTLKMAGIRKAFSIKPQNELGANINTIQYLGIASDEPIRIERHQKDPNKILPLVDIGWEETFCRKWCEENNLLSPIYAKSTRGGAGSVTIKAWTS